MPPSTDYVRHAARLDRKLQLNAGMGGTAVPDAECWKALEEIAAGLEQASRRE